MYLKHIINILLILFTGNSFSQESGFISGEVLNKNRIAIEIATLYNFSQKTSGLTNNKGEFKIKAEIGDSVRIQHLNYHTKEIEIKNTYLRLILDEKQFQINEVTVTPKAAFDLFNTACKNTWNSFKDENISRAYCRCIRKTNDYVAQTVDLDLDIIQKKQKRYKQGEQVSLFKVQERIDNTGTTIHELRGISLVFFYPQIHQLYWVELPNKFNYYKSENSENIVLRLFNKKDYNVDVNIELKINRKDTTLQSFAMIKKNLTTFSIGSDGITNKKDPVDDDFIYEKSYHYIAYDYDDGFGYLSEYEQGVVIAENKIRTNKIELNQQMKTYNNGSENLTRRRQRRRIFDNSYDLFKTTNRYHTEFWNAYNLGDLPYDFKVLENNKTNEDK